MLRVEGHTFIHDKLEEIETYQANNMTQAIFALGYFAGRFCQKYDGILSEVPEGDALTIEATYSTFKGLIMATFDKLETDNESTILEY